jgi:hypothetical protein
MPDPTLLTLLALAKMADKAYGSPLSGAVVTLGHYQAQTWKLQGNYGEDGQGFVGCVFVANDESHTVVAYAGTNPASKEDLKADLKIVMGWTPNQTKSATDVFERANQTKKGTLYLVGHSLGGALAQYVGAKKLAQFVTFNAPGMRRILENEGKVYKDTWTRARGVNYRMTNDEVSKWPDRSLKQHLGEVRTLDPGGTVDIFRAHSMTTVVNYIQKDPYLSNECPLPLPPLSLGMR